jgi:putative MATE family efflux protein
MIPEPSGQAVSGNGTAASVSADAAPSPAVIPSAGVTPQTQVLVPGDREMGPGVLRDGAQPAEIRRAVIALAWPAVIEYALTTFIGLANMMMVGRLGAAAVAAVGICNQPLLLAQGVFQALTVGSTAIVARHVGAGEITEASEAGRQSVVLTLGLGLLASLPFLIWARNVVVWIGAAADVVGPATTYMRVVGGGTVFTVAGIVVAAILRGAGDTRTPMRVNGIANVINVTVGLVLIFGFLGFPALGVAGAAYGALIARMVGTVLFLVALYGKRTRLPMSLRQSHRLTRPVVARIFRVGLPAALEQFVMRGGQVLFARIIASLGTVAFAAHQITVNAESLGYTPAQALAAASTTIVGQNLGAGQPNMADRGARETTRMAIVFMATVTLFVVVFTVPILRMYTSDQRVVDMGKFIMRLYAFALPAMGVYFVLVGALRGAGDTRFPLVISIIGIWCVRLVLGNFLALRLGLGLNGAWIAMVCDQWIRGLVSYMRFASGAWKRARV